MRRFRDRMDDELRIRGSDLWETPHVALSLMTEAR
jgi:hypothetical protein